MTEPLLVFQGKHFAVYHEAVDAPDGTTHTFEYVHRTDGARIIAINEEEVLITREFRHELDAFDWRLPGGKVDIGEAPQDAARRELREETGLTASSWRFLWTTTPDSTVRYKRHFFLASEVTLGAPEQDPGEDIRNHWLPLDDACTLALQGDIREEISALALLRLRYELQGR